MKDLINSEVAAEKRMQLTKMHDYKGFTIEPFHGGFNIIMYGVKNILYVSGLSGWALTEKLEEARAFHDPKTCHDLIDEIIVDWQGWIDSYKEKKQFYHQFG